MDTISPEQHGRDPRQKGIKTLVTADQKAAFRRAANARGVTESELLRELIEATIAKQK
jgi:hypothetical protein